MNPINPEEFRYIKLDRSGCWAQPAFERGELHFGYQTVSHDLCLQGLQGDKRVLHSLTRSTNQGSVPASFPFIFLSFFRQPVSRLPVDSVPLPEISSTTALTSAEVSIPNRITRALHDDAMYLATGSSAFITATASESSMSKRRFLAAA